MLKQAYTPHDLCDHATHCEKNPSIPAEAKRLGEKRHK
jgi:hypothetical protein